MGRTKHLDVRQLFIKKANAEGVVNLEWISSEENVADIFTKPLYPTLFNKHRNSMGIIQGMIVESTTDVE